MAVFVSAGKCIKQEGEFDGVGKKESPLLDKTVKC